MDNQKHIYAYNRNRAIYALICCILMVVLVFVGLMTRLFETNTSSGYSGTESYRLFTIDSNFLVGICALLAIPYQIDGIRTGDYHMPKWIIYVLFLATSGVTMTFLIAVTVLTPVAGAYDMLIKDSSLYFHVLNPIVAIIFFIFTANDHKINFKFTFIAMIPVISYALVYMVMVFFIGEANGGWKDHYRFGYYIPWPFTLVIMLTIAFGICTGLRLAHNSMHKKAKAIIKNYYQKAYEFQCPTIEEAICALAKDNKSHNKKAVEIHVSQRVISMLNEHYQSAKSIDELCELYLHDYLSDN